ncbi:hypothetical protein FQR65_LT00943 [Abscondita terminalis]|nr:hypothetical protein FQR65_LT00943 [Abscondita terminalis]
MSTLLLSILGLTLGAQQCSVWKEIAPCTCRNDRPTIIEIYCEKMSSYDQIVGILQNKFLPTDKVLLRIQSSSLHDLPQRTFKELNVTIENIQLNHDDLTDLSPTSFTGLPNLKYVSFSDNNLGSIPQKILEVVSNVKTLDLGRSGIRQLTEQSFKSVPDIQSIMLGGNFISQMDSNSIPRNIHQLHLGRNKIKDLNGTLVNLTDLHWVFINSNELTTLDHQLPSVAPNLMLIHASHNKIEKLPQHLKTLTSLQSLFLNNNMLTSLDGVLSKMSHLERAQFEYNKISTLTKEDFLETSSLHCLCLGNNYVTSINNSLSPLRSLNILNLTHNLLTEFSLQEIKGLLNLRTVDLSHNKIIALYGPTANLIEWDTKITEMILNNNELTKLNGALAGLPSLLKLDLSFNKISEISPDDLIGLDRLRILDVSHNHLTTLEETGKTVLPALNELIASYNKLTILDHDFHGLPVLCWADFSNNKIIALGRDLVRKTRCKEQFTWGTLKILLQDNPILCDAALPEIVAAMEINHTRISGVAHCAPLSEQPTTAKPNGYLGFIPEDNEKILAQNSNNVVPSYQQPLPYLNSHQSQNELPNNFHPKNEVPKSTKNNHEKFINEDVFENQGLKYEPVSFEKNDDSSVRTSDPSSNNVKSLDTFGNDEVADTKQVKTVNADDDIQNGAKSTSSENISVEQPIDPVIQQKQLDILASQIEQLRLKVEELTVQNKILSHTIIQSASPPTESNKTEHVRYEEVAIHTLPNDEPYLDKVSKGRGLPLFKKKRSNGVIKMLGALICAGVFCYTLFYGIILCVIDCDVQLAFNEKFGKSISHLKGKVVFITGASSGIGKHTALSLAEHGVKLVLAARRHELLQQVKAQCIAVSKGLLTANDVLVLEMDMLDMNSHKRNFEIALAHFGVIDILFNNAGRSQRALWEYIDVEVDKEMFELNVFSLINLTRIAIKYFNTRGRGHVAATSSLAGFVSAPHSASYTGAKHALHGYYNSLRLEKLSTDLTVSLICPGPTHTEFLRESFTGSPGQKYGIPTKDTDRRMTAERCGHLCAVALANESREAWLCCFPLLHFCYVYVYFPTLSYYIFKFSGTDRFFKLRDSNHEMTEVHTV